MDGWMDGYTMLIIIRSTEYPVRYSVVFSGGVCNNVDDESGKSFPPFVMLGHSATMHVIEVGAVINRLPTFRSGYSPTLSAIGYGTEL